MRQNLVRIFNSLDYNAKVTSQDKETKVSCGLYSRETKAVVAMASNRFVMGCQALPNTRPNKYHYIQHAEVNAIYDAARYGYSLNNSIAVVTHSPCVKCIRALWQVGIDTIYFKHWREETDIINFTLDLRGKLIRLKSGFYKLKILIRK